MNLFAQMQPMERNLTLLFLGIIVATILYFWKMKKNSHVVPSIVTVIGILGTFLGITIGLIDFDPKNIDESIPNLLAGLRFAFISSILGIVGSLICKYRVAHRSFIAELHGDTGPEGATIEDIINSLKQMIDGQKENQDQIKNSLEQVELALTGDGETTVLTQLQKLRTSMIDKQDELISEFKEFAETMTENNSKALIEALKEVIRDFNAKINEQFGENFKHLNEGVGRMLEWQKQYRIQMAELAEQIITAAEGIEISKTSLAEIVKHSETFSTTANTLKDLMLTYDTQVNELDEHLQAFDALADNAKKAFPLIEERLNSLTRDFSDHVKEAINSTQQSYVSLSAALESQSTTLDETVTSLTGKLSETVATSQNNLEKAINNTNGRLENIINQGNEMMQAQIKQLDQELERQLNESLGSLGNSLAGLSEKFVQDYTPLTERLREIVNISKG